MAACVVRFVFAKEAKLHGTCCHSRYYSVDAVADECLFGFISEIVAETTAAETAGSFRLPGVRGHLFSMSVKR